MCFDGHASGAFLAQYEVPEKTDIPLGGNETIEEALESLYPLVSEKGMDWMYSNCSTTAQRGALDWAQNFIRHSNLSLQNVTAVSPVGKRLRFRLNRIRKPITVKNWSRTGRQQSGNVAGRTSASTTKA